MGVYIDTAAAAADGVIHHWTFDDFTPGYFADQVGNWHAQVRNPSSYDVTAAIVPTPTGNGLDTWPGKVQNYYNEDDLILLTLPVTGRNNSLNIPNYTVKFRFYYTGTAEPTMVYGVPEPLNIGNHDGGLLQSPGFLLVQRISGDEIAATTGQFSNDTIGTGVVPNSGAWVDIVIRGESGVATNIYWFGTKDVDAGSSTGLTIYAQEGRIGFSELGLSLHRFLNGILDELTIWDRALSDAEITALYDGGQSMALIGTPPGGGGGGTPEPETPIFTPPLTVSQIQYFATITGTDDSLPDVVVPVSSINARYRTGAESYISVVIPNGSIYEQAITDRPNADISISRQVGGQSTELLNVNLEQMRVDEGSSSGVVITLTGHKQTTNASPKTVTINPKKVSYYRNGDSSTGIRMLIDPDIKPGDTVVFRGQNIVVAVVTYNISTEYQTMELST